MRIRIVKKVLKSGQITIPNDVRRFQHIKPGDIVVLELKDVKRLNQLDENIDNQESKRK